MRGPKEWILVRHGQSTANARGIWQGQLDFPLSGLGRQQAEKAGRAIAAGEVTAVYTSPLSRASETAEIIAREVPGARGVIRIPGLVERRGGWFEGRTREEMAAENPELVKKLRSLPEEDRWPLVGAETDGEVLARFEAAMADISERYEDDPDARVVVVSHGGALRAFLRSRFGPEVLPEEERAPNASVTRLFQTSDGGLELVELASVTHLE